MKGYIQLLSLSQLRHVDEDPFDTKLFIVRSPGKVMTSLGKKGFIHAPGLSPSSSLFWKTKNDWEKDIFTDEEIKVIESGPTQTYWDLYTREFVKEIKERPDLVANLKRVEELLDSGKNILMLCYCKSVLRCHRGILGMYLNKRGYDVRFN